MKMFNKYGFNLDSIEEKVLYRSLIKGLRIEGVDETNENNHYSGKLSHYSSHMNKPELTEEVLINIDGVLLTFITYKYYRTKHINHYMNYYVYKYKIGDRYWMNLYLPMNYVLDGEIFYTRKKEERRIIKIKQLIEKTTNG